MKILSLFDGMACGMIAMMNAGVTVDTYDAYEIDKYAIQTSQHNFPMIKQHGDVFGADFTQYEGVDYVVGGSPCTFWSIAQKNNRETEASGFGWELFQQYVRAIKEAKPKFFIYENNKSMSRQIRACIDAAFGFEAIGINSALLSAQNRQRLYWVGKRNEDGTYSKVDVPQPEDKGVLLKDILETGEDLTGNEKSFCLTSSYGGAVAWNTIERNQRNMVAERIPEYSCDKSRPLTASYANKSSTDGSLPSNCFPDNPNKQVWDMVAEPVRVGDLPNAKGEISGSQSTRTYSVDGKSVNLVEHSGGQGAKTGLYAVPTNFQKSTAIYEVKDGFITIKNKQYPIKLADGFYIIRKLSVSECKRLQTVPEGYDFSVVSDTQAYKMLGNGWTCDVIAHLIKETLT